jgi:hypothetical protein
MRKADVATKEQQAHPALYLTNSVHLKRSTTYYTSDKKENVFALFPYIMYT